MKKNEELLLQRLLGVIKRAYSDGSLCVGLINRIGGDGHNLVSVSAPPVEAEMEYTLWRRYFSRYSCL